MDLCALTLDDLISIGMILAFDAIRKSISQFHRDISADRMHPWLDLLFPRDYFDRPDASLSDSFAPQGLLYPGQMHLYLALLFHRDYFARLNASLSGSFVPQGLFRPAECISIWLFCSIGIFRLPGCIPSLEGHH